jgi:DNA modification methylase
MSECRLICGDAVQAMREIPDASVDAVITDPPYPEISRPYGRLTEPQWFALMDAVVSECRRVLKPNGSAMFVLQPNSRKVGSMRTWLWRFMADWGERWNMVQDAWWWNIAALPEAHAIQGRLMRPSLKACVWLGPAGCYRDQDAVLWTEAELTAMVARCARARNAGRIAQPSGQVVNRSCVDDAARRRGGVTPFNVFPTTQGQGKSSRVAASYGHPAGTPFLLADWWVRYISPPGGMVLDPFAGSGTVPLAALARGRLAIGIEQYAPYFEIMSRRVDAARLPLRFA